MTAHGDLSGRTSRGAVLTLAGNLLVKGLSLLVLLLVARVLDAGAYGLAVLALGLFGFAEVMTNPALQTTLLREPHLDDRTVDVACTLNLVRGVAMTTALFALAPSIASWWPEQQEVMAGYLRVLSCTFLIQGLQNLHAIRLRRELRFAKAFLLDSAPTLVGPLFVIAALWSSGEAVWMVAGPPVGAAAGALVSISVARPLPRLRFDSAEATRLCRFSTPLLISAVMVFILLHGDDLFVEHTAGFAALGVYALSFRWSNAGILFVVHGLQGILTPAYLKLRDDPARLRHAVLNSLTVLCSVSLLIGAMLVAFADELFWLVGGSTAGWQGAAAIARALVPLAMSRGINATLTPVFLVAGKPHWLTWMTAVQLAAFWPAMVAGSAAFGVVGVALAVSMLSLGVSLAKVFAVRPLIGLQPHAIVRAIVPGLLMASTAGTAGWLTTAGIADPGARLLVGATTTGITFLVLWELLCRHRIADRLPQRSFLAIAGLLGR